MAFKKSISRRKAMPRRKRVFRKASKKASSIVRVRSLVIPRSQFIRVVDEFQGYIAPAAGKTSGFATIYGNKLYQPYNTGIPITTSPFGTLVPTTGCSINDNFAGYSLVSAQYNNYKIYGVKLTITCRPENSADTIQFGAFPWADGQAATLSSMDIDQYVEQPYGRNKIAYSQVRGDKIVLKTSPAKVLGLSKLQYKVLPQNAVGLISAPVSNLLFNYAVFWRTLDNADLTANMIFTFRLERYVQFYTPNNLL